MKRIFTTFCFCLCLVSIMAQNLTTLVFADKNGKEIADGSVITANTTEEDALGDLLVPSGLFIKNLSSESVGVRVKCNVTTLDNGIFQICFPVTCISKSVMGAFDTGSDLISSGELRNLLTEWMPETYGTCSVTYQIELMKQVNLFPPTFESLEMGPKVTVNFVYTDPAGIDEVSTTEVTVVERYGANGMRLSAPHKGLNILKLSDGRVVKQYCR